MTRSLKKLWMKGKSLNSVMEETDGRGGSTSTALPVEADMVLAYATVPGECIAQT